MSGTCNCHNYTKPEAGYLLGPKGEILMAFRKSCPVHGIEVLSYVDRVPVRRQAWVTAERLRQMRRFEKMCLLDVRPDGSAGLVEWTEWVLPEPAAAQAA